jgi:hypothetical protein
MAHQIRECTSECLVQQTSSLWGTLNTQRIDGKKLLAMAKHPSKGFRSRRLGNDLPSFNDSGMVHWPGALIDPSR